MIKRLLLIGVLFIGGCLLPALPDVTPVPPAPIVQTADKLTIITIDEMTDRAGPFKDLMVDLSYWNGLEAKGHKHWDFSPATATMYAAQIAEAGGPPCVIFMDSSNAHKLAVVKLSNDTNEAAFDELVKRYTGSK